MIVSNEVFIYRIKFCWDVITSPGVNNLGILSPVIREVFTLFDASRILIVVVIMQTLQYKINEISCADRMEFKQNKHDKIKVMWRNSMLLHTTVLVDDKKDWDDIDDIWMNFRCNVLFRF